MAASLIAKYLFGITGCLCWPVFAVGFFVFFFLLGHASIYGPHLWILLLIDLISDLFKSKNDPQP